MFSKTKSEYFIGLNKCRLIRKSQSVCRQLTQWNDTYATRRARYLVTRNDDPGKLRRGNWRNNTSLSLQDWLTSSTRAKGMACLLWTILTILNVSSLAMRQQYVFGLAKKKYKSINNSRTKAGKLMERIHKEKPRLFVHWREGLT